MHAVKFADFVVNAKRGQSLMARIALNASGNAKTYPVDAFELRNLCPENRAMVNAFLDWAVVHNEYRFGLPALPRLKALA